MARFNDLCVEERIDEPTPCDWCGDECDGFIHRYSGFTVDGTDVLICLDCVDQAREGFCDGLASRFE